MAMGRPTVMTPQTVQKLEQAFLMGCTDREACLYADISSATLYNYCNANPDFLERKERLKDNPVLLSRSVVMDALRDGDRDMAKDVLKRKEGSKLALTGADGGPVQLQEVRRTIVDPANPHG